MKRFKFKLEKILKYRKILKEMQESKVVRAQKAHEVTKRDIDELDVERKRIHDAMIENAEESFSLVAQQGQETFNHKIEFSKNKEKIRLAKRSKSLEIERNKLVEHAKREKAIEKLKDKAKELHKKECLDLEMKQIDDLVNARFNQQSLYGLS